MANQVVLRKVKLHPHFFEVSNDIIRNWSCDLVVREIRRIKLIKLFPASWNVAIKFVSMKD